MKVSLKFTFDYSIWSFWNKCKNQQISKKAKKQKREDRFLYPLFAKILILYGL